MRHRRYLGFFALIFILAMLGRLAVGIVFDPFADFYFLAGWRFPNVHTVDQFAEIKVKLRLIKDVNADRIGAAVIGNSRAAVLDPTAREFQDISPDGYNLAFSGANLLDIKEMVVRLVERHPQAVPIIAIDFDHCTAATGFNSANPYLRPTNPLFPYKDAASRLFSVVALNDWFMSSLNNLAYDRVIMPQGHLKRNFSFDDKSQIVARANIDRTIYTDMFRTSDYHSECIDVLREIRDIAPQTVLYSHPMTDVLREAIANAGREAEFQRWRMDMATLGRYLDFTCTTKFAKAPAAFIDGHHVSAATGRAITADIAAYLNGRPLATGCAVPP